MNDADGQQPTLQCRRCPRLFARPDHLARHVRTHTHEKPFSCSKCANAFARADLLKRHERRHHSDQRVYPSAHGGPNARTAKACTRCAASKLKCNDERPCQRCIKKGVPCIGTAGTPRQTMEQQAHAHPQNVNASSYDMSDIATSDMQSYPRTSTTIESSQMPSDASLHAAPGSFTDLLNDMLFTQTSASENARQRDGSALNTLNWNHCASLDFGLSDLEFSFPTVLPSFSAPAAVQSFVSPRCNSPEHRSPELIISAEGAKAFQASVWHWVPSSLDTGAANEPDPTHVPIDIPSSLDDDDRLHPDILAKRLGPSERDRILSVILDRCDKANLVHIATSFPAQHTLEKLPHTALHLQTVGSPLAWIHIPTFTTGLVRSELLCALVACGASLSPMTPVQALGSAMPDLIHHKIMEHWVRNNATTRDLELCQAHALVQHILLWAGSKRRMEFGEGITQPLVTIMRRSGMLQRDHHPLEPPSIDDDEAKLNLSWQIWVKRESTIRLAHQMFVHDVQTSMTRFIKPLLPCDEMKLPLTADDELWYASTAEQWRTCWLAKIPELTTRPSLSELVRDSFSVPWSGPVSCDQAGELSSSSTVMRLYGLWDMIWNCQRTSSWLRAESFQYHTLPLGLASHSELVSHVLGQLEPGIMSSATGLLVQDDECPDFSTVNNCVRFAQEFLIFHHLSLALYAPLKRFLEFAGKEGEAEARQAYLLLQEWVQTRDSRRSL